MRNHKITAALLLTVMCTSACASIIEGRRQTLNVSTTRAEKGQCVLKDARGMSYNVYTPGAVIVNRGDGPIDVTCTLPDAEGKGTVGENVEPWIIGNIIFGLGGIIGLGIDAATGAYLRYPENVVIQVNNMVPGSSVTTTQQPLDFKQSTPSGAQQ